MRGRSIFRPFLLQRSYTFRSISSHSSAIGTAMSVPKPNPPITPPPSVSAIQNLYFSSRLPHFSRSFNSSSGPSNFVLVKSEEELNNALTKAQGESLPAIFYFTAAWCGPCRLISPKIEELTKEYPHVTTYKIDIDQEGIRGTLEKLSISAVPTLHFFHNGKRDSEIVGVDIARLNNTVEKLYKKD